MVVLPEPPDPPDPPVTNQNPNPTNKHSAESNSINSNNTATKSTTTMTKTTTTNKVMTTTMIMKEKTVRFADNVVANAEGDTDDEAPDIDIQDLGPATDDDCVDEENLALIMKELDEAFAEEAKAKAANMHAAGAEDAEEETDDDKTDEVDDPCVVGAAHAGNAEDTQEETDDEEAKCWCGVRKEREERWRKEDEERKARWRKEDEEMEARRRKEDKEWAEHMKKLHATHMQIFKMLAKKVKRDAMKMTTIAEEEEEDDEQSIGPAKHANTEQKDAERHNDAARDDAKMMNSVDQTAITEATTTIDDEVEDEIDDTDSIAEESPTASDDPFPANASFVMPLVSDDDLDNDEDEDNRILECCFSHAHKQGNEDDEINLLGDSDDEDEDNCIDMDDLSKPAALLNILNEIAEEIASDEDSWRNDVPTLAHNKKEGYHFSLERSDDEDNCQSNMPSKPPPRKERKKTSKKEPKRPPKKETKRTPKKEIKQTHKKEKNEQCFTTASRGRPIKCYPARKHLKKQRVQLCPDHPGQHSFCRKQRDAVFSGWASARDEEQVHRNRR